MTRPRTAGPARPTRPPPPLHTPRHFFATGTHLWAAGREPPAIHPPATLLRNGHVFGAGGNGLCGFQASAEMYDPATNSWSSGGGMAPARLNHTATLLDNGEVLVAGGLGTASFVADAEVYDPVA